MVTFNQNLLDGQLRGLTQHLDKARHKLRDLQIQLQRRRQGKVKGGNAPTVESVQKQIDSICSAQFVKKIVQTEVRKIRQGLELTFHTHQVELDRLCRVQFGKTILFTDNADWSEEQIVQAYRSQYHIEDAFKQMKNPHFLGWSPMFHWTDSKIQVHASLPAIYINLDASAEEDIASKTPAAGLPWDRFRLVRAHVKGDKRIVGAIKTAVYGKVTSIVGIPPGPRIRPSPGARAMATQPSPQPQPK